MKKTTFLAWVAAAALLVPAAALRAAPPAAISEDPCIGAIVVDASTGEVLKEDRSGRPGYPASMLKLMNLFVTLDAVRDGRVSLSDNVRVTRSASRVGGSQVWLDPRETFPLEELIYAMMVHSANDAAYLIAEHVAGSAPAFVERMNEKARELGLSPVTHFVSPHGLPPDNNGRPDMTTAADFAKLCVALLREHPETLRYTGAKEYRFRAASPQGFQPMDLVNRNHLIGKFPGCDGLKTGYFKRAGFSLAATAERNGRRVIAVIVGSKDSHVRDRLAGEWLEYGLQHAKTPPPPPVAVAPAVPAAAPSGAADSAGGARAEDGNEEAAAGDSGKDGKGTSWWGVLGWMVLIAGVGGIAFFAVKRRLLVSNRGNVRVRK